ncbi:MAG: tetratricopeptide repeat protein [Leptolyngbyaceae cyanobacterium RU_5_1]|nr:tetratricopeptide repeat protein [Leptolyngbyaceae cyanobacterium RU_5_1]
MGDREEDETVIAIPSRPNSRGTKLPHRTAPIPRTDYYTKWFEQGRDLEKSQRYAEALQAFDQAIQLCSNDPAVWRSRGSVLYILGHNEQAVASYKRASQLKGDSAEIWYGLGGCLIRLRKYEEAIAAFDRAIELQPKHPIPWYWRGRALFELQQYSDALQSFEQAIALKPDFHPAIADCKRAQLRLEKLEQQNVAV